MIGTKQIAAKAAKGGNINNGSRFSALGDFKEMEMEGIAADQAGVSGGISNRAKSAAAGASQNRMEGTASPEESAVDMDTTEVVVSHKELLNGLRSIAGEKMKAAIHDPGEARGSKKHKEKLLKDATNALEIRAPNLKHGRAGSKSVDGLSNRERKLLKRAEKMLAGLEGPLVNVKAAKEWASIVFPDSGVSRSRPLDPQEEYVTGEPSSCPSGVEIAEGDREMQGDVVEVPGGANGDADTAMGGVTGMAREKMASFNSKANDRS